MCVIKGKCGTDCGTCQFKDRFHCAGCHEQGGEPFWGNCEIYVCAASKGLAHCGMCENLPCDRLIEFIENGHNPDRMTNLNKWKHEKTTD